MGMSIMNFRENFNTPLDEENASRFKRFVSGGKKQLPEAGDLLEDYDLAGEWFDKGGGGAVAQLGSDPKFRKPNNRLFSTDSKYNGAPAPDGGLYLGGKLSGEEGSQTFVPSLRMLSTTHPPERLGELFPEGGAVKLIYPRGYP